MQPSLRSAIVHERGSSKPSLPHSLQPHPHHPAPSILTHIHPSVQLPVPHSLSPSHQLLLLLHQVAVLLLSPLHLRVRSNAHFPLPMVPFSPLLLSSSLIMLVPQRMVYDWMPSSVAINLTTMVCDGCFDLCMTNGPHPIFLLPSVVHSVLPPKRSLRSALPSRS